MTQSSLEMGVPAACSSAAVLHKPEEGSEEAQCKRTATASAVPVAVAVQCAMPLTGLELPQPDESRCVKVTL